MDKVILNVDTGIDDAFAMILLKRYGITPEFIVASSGNTLLENTYRNTVGVANLLGFDCPVYYGSSRPLVKPHYFEDFHGKNGLGCYNFPGINIEKNSENGIIKMYEALKHNKYTIICTSPLTSLGILISLDRKIIENINNIIIMGGAFGFTPYGKGNMGDSEFNIFYDPEAAKIVMEADIDETIVPLDLTMDPGLAIKKLPGNIDNTSLNDFILKTTKFMIEEHRTYELHDPIAAFSFIDQQAFKFVNGDIKVNSEGVTKFIENHNSKKKVATMINYDAYQRKLVEKIYGQQ
jgi:inosine-uridine nucleoside N-ribohydrolase